MKLMHMAATVVLMGTLGCSAPAIRVDTPAGNGNSVAASVATPSQPRRLNAKDFRTFVEKPGTIILDVRTQAEYATSHLAEAKLLDVQSPTFADEVKKLDRNARYGVYCRSGKRSQTAIATMKAAGFADIADLDGGIIAWTDAGFDTVK